MREDEKRCLLVHGLDCEGTLYPVPAGACRIEFVGDSLSSGVGLAGAPSLVGAGPAVYGPAYGGTFSGGFPHSGPVRLGGSLLLLQ